VAEAGFLMTMVLNSDIQNVDSAIKLVVASSQKGDYKIPGNIFQYEVEEGKDLGRNPEKLTYHKRYVYM
jgi:beta-galactosidase beta subunit